MSRWLFRQATAQDASALAELYNYYIEHTVITFEYDTLTPEDMATRLKQITRSGEFIVAQCRHSKAMLGFAYAKPWNDRAGFRHTYESSIYLKHDRDLFAHKGLGSELYQRLIASVSASGKVKVLMGVVNSGNNASIALHRKLGFQQMATLPDIAIKFDRSLGIDYWVKYLT